MTEESRRPAAALIQSLDLAAADEDWRRAVLAQVKWVGFAAVVTVLGLIVWAGPNDVALRADSITELLQNIALSGRLQTGSAMTAVTGLLAFVGALSVALVVAPRVNEEQVPVDRVALARWGAATTILNAGVAGVAVGVSLTQLFSEDVAGGMVMSAMSFAASAMAVISVQRRYDIFHGGLGHVAIAQRRAAVQKLHERFPRVLGSAPPRVAATGKADGRRIMVSIGGLYLGCAAVSFGGLVAMAGGVDPSMPGFWFEMVYFAVLEMILVAFCLPGWVVALQQWMLKTGHGRGWPSRVTPWLGASLGPGFVTYAYWVASESERLTFQVIGFAVLPPTLAGIFLAGAATRGKGWWAPVARQAVRDLRREIRIANRRQDDLVRVLGEVGA